MNLRTPSLRLLAYVCALGCVAFAAGCSEDSPSGGTTTAPDTADLPPTDVSTAEDAAGEDGTSGTDVLRPDIPRPDIGTSDASAGDGSGDRDTETSDAAAGNDTEDSSEDAGREEIAQDDASADVGEPPPDTSIGPREVSGAQSGDWCGDIVLTGDTSVPADGTLTLCAGTQVFSQGPGLQVDGSLIIEGTEEAPVLLGGEGWNGIDTNGSLVVDHAVITDAATGIIGRSDSTVTLRNVVIADSTGRGFQLLGESVFERVTVLGGGSVTLSSGSLMMTDSVIDLGHPRQSPDCFVVNGGTLTIDHSHITGCHCPLHINGSDGGVTVTNSVLDTAAYAVMIAFSEGTFHFNNMESASDHFLDIGGGLSADISDNYTEGGAPEVGTSMPGQFSGADSFASAPYPTAGPRP